MSQAFYTKTNFEVNACEWPFRVRVHFMVAENKRPILEGIGERDILVVGSLQQEAFARAGLAGKDVSILVLNRVPSEGVDLPVEIGEVTSQFLDYVAKDGRPGGLYDDFEAKARFDIRRLLAGMPKEIRLTRAAEDRAEIERTIDFIYDYDSYNYCL